MNFLYCFDDETKIKLLNNGYKFIKQVELNNQSAFLFANNGQKMSFNMDKICFTDRLNF